MSLAGPIKALLFKLGWILLAIICLIGIIMFFLTLPGIVMEKIKGLAKAIGNAWASWWGEDSAAQVENSQIYEVLDYLDEMGYDLKGYGFVTQFLTTTASDEVNGYDKGGDDVTEVPEEQRKLTTDGVIRNTENDTVITAKSDFIKTYLISDNYIYTIKNFNTDTGSKLEALWDHFSALFSDNMNRRSGMLVFYHDKYDDRVGYTTDDAYDAWERGYIKFDSGKLLVKKGWTNDAMAYSLDGWTGRYGMPIDFLISLHLATQMPDLAYDMTQKFETEVRILLHNSSSDGEVRGAYNSGSGYVEYDTLNSALNVFEGRNILTRLITNLDNLGLNPEEAQAAFDLGIIPSFHNPPECGCQYSETNVYVNGDYTYILYPVTEEDSDAEAGDAYYYLDYSTNWENPKHIYVSENDPNIKNSEKLIEVGSNCKKYIKKVISLMNSHTDYSYETYIPYIEKVTQHWFRDVYFISDTSSNFVDYDYQYEVVTGERWTLYETYTNNPDDGELYDPEKYGEFVYYYLKPDGTTGDRYKGDDVETGEVDNPDTESDSETIRVAARTPDGEPLVKKAKTVNLKNQHDDLGWNELELSSGTYSAYDEEFLPSSEYQQAYTEEDIAEEDDEIYKEAMKKIYVVLEIGTISQTGEGLRTETNPEIKKMFLQNKYFKYDGSQTRAEIIYALRKAAKADGYAGYGAIEDEKILNKAYTLDFSSDEYVSESLKENTNNEYKISDYVASVTFNQTSLDAFSMLENTHTLDADYIYKDFKELVVELGYFEKEELTESAPRLLQFIVPDIGSGGFPDRSIDKREGEYGTMVHSKADIDANEKNTITYLLSNMDDELEDGGFIDTDSTSAINVNQSVGNISSQLDGRIENGINLSAVKGLSDSNWSKDPVASPENDGYDTTTTVNGVIYKDYKQGNYPDTRAYTVNDSGPISSHGCSVSSSAIVLSGYGIDMEPPEVADTLGWSLQSNARVATVALTENGVPAEWFDCSGSEAQEKIIQATDEGKPVIALMKSGGSVSWTSGGHFVAILGIKNDGTVLVSDPGHRDDQHNDKCPEQLSEMVQYMTGVAIPLEAPTGAKRTGDSYEGYKGNEAVVSPVTGILMEYGTYNAEDAQENRENIDLKYGGLLEGKEYKTQEVTTTDPLTGEETTTTEILYPYDKVGYAVIKVLDAETYQKLESTVTNRWQSSSLLKISDKAENDKLEVQSDGSVEGTVKSNKHISFREDGDLESEDRDWSILDESVYGYKEFVESYESFGIAGYYIYIDGFKCEEVGETAEESENGEETAGENESLERSPKITTPGDPLTLDSFKVNWSDLSEDYEYETESKYESDEISKLISEGYYKKLKAESEIKNSASLGITFNYQDQTEINEYILIKEGTVLGRTFTDEEIVNDREGNYGTYDEYLEAQKQASGDIVNGANGEVTSNQVNENGEIITEKLPLMGNYLRIIMQDEDGDIVENVEDYMKLDEGESSQSGDQEYQFQEGDLEILADAIHHEGCGSYDDPSGSQEDKLYLSTSVGYTIINKLNTDSGFSPDYNESSNLWDSSKSPLYNLVCRIPSGWDTGGYTLGTSKGWYAIALGLRKRIDANNLEYCDTCLEAAEYIKENDSMNFKNNGKYETTYNSGDGMPHTCWEQGANYYGGRVWAHFRNDWLFDPKDK